MVECTALEMRHRCKPIGGSNPSLSAKTFFVQPEDMGSHEFVRNCVRSVGTSAGDFGLGATAHIIPDRRLRDRCGERPNSLAIRPPERRRARCRKAWITGPPIRCERREPGVDIFSI